MFFSLRPNILIILKSLLSDSTLVFSSFNKKLFSKNSSLNKVAKKLSDRKYYQRVVKSKKLYDRKKIKQQMLAHSQLI